MGKVNRKRLGILIVSALIIMIFLGFILLLTKKDNPLPQPENGILDLQAWDPQDKSLLGLSGEWDFYWERFITYQELLSDHPVPDITVKVPEVWNKYEIKGEKLPGFGYASYVLKVVNAPKGIELALRIPTFSTAYELYINDRLVSSNGKIGTSPEQAQPGYMPRVIELTQEEESFTLIFHVSNFTYARGGM